MAIDTSAVLEAFYVGLCALLGGGLYVFYNHLYTNGLYVSAAQHLGFALAAGFFTSLLTGLTVPSTPAEWLPVLGLGYFGTDVIGGIVAKLPAPSPNAGAPSTVAGPPPP